MLNPKTTWAGLLALVAAIATAGAHFLLGVPISADVQLIVTAIVGLLAGFVGVAAKDGGA